MGKDEVVMSVSNAPSPSRAFPPVGNSQLPHESNYRPRPVDTSLGGQKSRLKASLWAWNFEALCAVMSLASMFAIVAVLGTYDQRPLQTLPLSITLNAFLAFFTTLTRVMLMLPVVEALSQWKWNLLNQQDRPLDDFVLMDRASRSFWGSVDLVRRLHIRHIATAGAMVTILGLVTSPITQQMVKYPSRTVEQVNGTATIQTVNLYNFNSSGLLVQAIISSLVSSDKSALGAFCTSSKCTFPQYQSLGVCSRSANVTSHLSISTILNSTSSDWSLPHIELEDPGMANVIKNGTMAWNASLETGFSFVTTSRRSFQVLPSNRTIAFTDDADMASLTFLRLFIIWNGSGDVTVTYANDTSVPRFEAVEIALYLCVKTFETRFDQSRSTTTVVRTSHKPAEVPGNMGNVSTHCFTYSDLFRYACPKKEVIYPPPTKISLADPAVPDQVFAAGASDMMYTSEFLGQISSGYFYQWPTNSTNYRQMEDYIVRRAIYSTDRPPMASITDFYEGAATVVTNFMRSSSGQTIQGTAWRDETFIQVDWGWLTLLAAQVLVSILLLIVTVAHTHAAGVPVLKSSILAALLAPAEDVRLALGNIGQLAHAEKQARQVMVQLEPGRGLEMRMAPRPTRAGRVRTV